MELRPRLVETRGPGAPEGVVLVLHGGAARGESAAVSPAQPSVLRMLPIAHRVARRGRGRLAVLRLLNSSRGWDRTRPPLDDVAWALDEVARRYGADLPVSLVGHSLGGRAALLSASHPRVRSAVALAPWVYPGDGAGLDLTGRRLLVVHGLRDRIASPDHARAVARDLARTAEVGFITIPDGTHSMLRHHGQFDAYAADFAVATLVGEPVSGALPDPVARVLAGEQWVDA